MTQEEAVNSEVKNEVSFLSRARPLKLCTTSNIFAIPRCLLKRRNQPNSRDAQKEDHQI